MDNLGIVFLTGLTTGGLSCLAIQGGLLASSVAKQAEDDLLNTPIKPERLLGNKFARSPEFAAALIKLRASGLSRKRHQQQLLMLKQRYPKQKVVPLKHDAPSRNSARPVFLFLGARLVSYTILGAFLGIAGSMLQLTPYMRAALQITIGIYMLGLALHLLNVHPFFRHFMLQPPRFVTRYIRRKAKSGSDDLVTPTFLGFMTVFIPCGITIAMMALAIGTGNALAGAAIMFAFILGTSPLFFALAYAAVKLGARKQALFMKFAAVVVLVLGLVALEGGLNLAGSPLSYANIRQSLNQEKPPTIEAQPAAVDTLSPATSLPQAPTAQNAPPPATPKVEDAVLRMSATSESYSPSVIKAKAGQPYKLEIDSQGNRGCGRGLTIPSLGLQQVLPEDGKVTIDLPAQEKGTVRITCAMGMYNAKIQYE